MGWRREAKPERTAVTEQMTLTVNGMTCGGCENAVKRVVSNLPGISEVTASHRAPVGQPVGVNATLRQSALVNPSTSCHWYRSYLRQM